MCTKQNVRVRVKIYATRSCQNNAEHACKRHKYICKVLTHMRAHFCLVCSCMCTDLYKKKFVVHYFVINISFKFHKELIFPKIFTKLSDVFLASTYGKALSTCTTQHLNFINFSLVVEREVSAIL